MLRQSLLIIAILLCCLASTATAGDNDPATSTITTGNLIVPYDGYLALDSTPMNGQLNLQFDLYDVANGGVPVWTEVQSGVSFYNGRFSVGLGSQTAVTDVVLDAEKIYLAISIDDGTGIFIPLSGRQAIEAVPYAAWSANAADLNVAGDLAVGGTSQLNDTVTITKQGADAQLLRLNAERAWSFFQDGNSALRFESASSGTNKDLYIVTDGSLILQAKDRTTAVNLNASTGGVSITGNLGASSITAGGSLTANGIATLQSDTTVGGDLTVTGDITSLTVSGSFTANQNNAGQVSTPMVANDGDSFCFLTRVVVRDTTDDTEEAGCRVVDSGGVWTLIADVEATVGSPDADAYCSAKCLSW